MGTKNDIREQDSLNIYLKEIHTIPVLTFEKEQELGAKIKKGDKESFDILVKSNLRFVVSVAKKYIGRGIPLEDLINEGNIGLINSVENFDFDKGYHFITYAKWGIKQEILKAIYEKSHLIRMPINKLKNLPYINAELDSSNKDIPALSKKLNIPIKDLEKLLSFSEKPILSLDLPNSEGEESFIQVESSYISQSEEVIDKDYLEKIEKEMDKVLSEREKRIIEYRFGLGGIGERTLEETSMILGMGVERTRQVQARALQKLHTLEIEKLYSA